MKTKTPLFFSVLLIFLAFAVACTGKTTTSEANPVANSVVNAGPVPTPPDGGAQAQTAIAAALVADLYKQHDAKKSPFFQTKNRALVDKYFVKTLADLIWKDANNSSGEVGAIDGDPLYNAQDTEIKNFVIGKAEIKNDTATVPVTFTNFGTKQAITFSLKRVEGAWKIDNILYGPGDSLLKWLKDTYSTKTETKPASSGDFEGRFQVGDTTCTVKPVKMAFEVRWAKGKGVETFLFKDGMTFESSDKGGPNSFVFDDDQYDSGMFYRADGKSFPVTRAK